jgi:hypothetical protein
MKSILVTLELVLSPALAQELTITGIPDDWTHHHIVFSNPGTEAEAIKNGTHDRWLRIVNDPRYQLQQLQRGQGTAPSPSRLGSQPPAAPARGTFAVPAAHANSAVSLSRTRAALVVSPAPDNPGGPTPDKRHHLRKDWSMDLGAGAMGLTSFPAPASYRACAAPYSSDTIYIGDDTGVLHQFTGVFSGTPAENTTSPWPVTLSANPLSQPVLDHVSGRIFVGDTGGFYCGVNSSTAAVTGTSAQLDFRLRPVGRPPGRFQRPDDLRLRRQRRPDQLLRRVQRRIRLQRRLLFPD